MLDLSVHTGRIFHFPKVEIPARKKFRGFSDHLTASAQVFRVIQQPDTSSRNLNWFKDPRSLHADGDQKSAKCLLVELARLSMGGGLEKA